MEDISNVETSLAASTFEEKWKMRYQSFGNILVALT